jgi:hypothetical protein
MTVYVANVNGDWWTYNEGQPLFIMDTANLTESEMREILEDHEGFENDKFEDVIMAYGKQVTLHV